MPRLMFEKLGRGRYISHLDLMRTFQRAFFRAGLRLWHTEGFHAHAYVSIALPLSVGYGSMCEILEFRLQEECDLAAIPARLNETLPEGIRVRTCYEEQKPIKELTYVQYRVVFTYDVPPDESDLQGMKDLFSRKELVVEKKSKKARRGFVEVDLIPLMEGLTFAQKGCDVEINGLFRAQNPGMNPELLVTALAAFLPHMSPSSASYLRLGIFDGEKKPFG